VRVGKYMSRHTSSEMGNYIENFSITSTNIRNKHVEAVCQTCRWTIYSETVFYNMQHFLFCVFRTYIRFPNCEREYLLNEYTRCCY